MGNSKKKLQRREAARKEAERRTSQILSEFGVPDLLHLFDEKDAFDKVIPHWNANLCKYIENHKPKRLSQARKLIRSASSIAFEPASTEEFQNWEAKFALSIPESMRAFYSYSNGLRLDSTFWLEPLAKIESLEDCFPRIFKQAKKNANEYGPIEIPDNEYFVYGPEQDEYCYRYQYLQNALLLNRHHTHKTRNAGDETPLLLLVPDVQFEDGEYEIWEFSWHGVVRHKSFLAAFHALYKQWQQEIVYEHSPYYH